MELFKTKKELSQALDQDRKNGLSIGFVPTMGALHRGHLSLVERAVLENERVIVSIFVNPTQFNNPDDLKNYPRTLEADIQLLSTSGCDYLFCPTVGEMYPGPDNRKFDFGTLETVMEGRFRPGHFNGVAQVVSKLFDLVRPDHAYFGLKDFQQYAIINKMVAMLALPVSIVPCDTMREADGLAMSSRNRLLSDEHRAVAPQIHALLQEARKEAPHSSPAEIIRHLKERMDPIGLLELEYFEIVDEKTLLPVSDWNQPGRKVGCIAVYAGQVRLIDNIFFDS